MAYQVIHPVRTFGLLALVRFFGLLSGVDVEAEGDGLLVWALELQLLSAMLTNVFAEYQKNKNGPIGM